MCIVTGSQERTVIVTVLTKQWIDFQNLPWLQMLLPFKDYQARAVVGATHPANPCHGSTLLQGPKVQKQPAPRDLTSTSYSPKQAQKQACC